MTETIHEIDANRVDDHTARVSYHSLSCPPFCPP